MKELEVTDMYRQDQRLKKKCRVAICVAALGIMAGCGDASGKTANRTSNQKSEIERVMEAQMASEDVQAGNISLDGDQTENAGNTSLDGKQTENAGNTDVKSDAENKEQTKADNSQNQNSNVSYGTDLVEVDLAAISGDVVYAQVYDMMTRPEDYVGKVVKMKGNYTFYHEEETNIDYHACIIQDATACCAQGIEFEPVTGFTCEEDRPAENELITVTGVFDTYMDGEYEYCTLRNAVVEG